MRFIALTLQLPPAPLALSSSASYKED